MFLPDCGLGSDPNDGGPCTGTYGPTAQQASHAGEHAYDGVHSSGVVVALLGAAALVAGVIFVVWVVRKVGGFFSGVGGAPVGTVEHADEFWAAAGRADRVYRDVGRAGSDDDDVEDADEDDEEDTGELEHDDDAPRLEHRA